MKMAFWNLQACIMLSVKQDIPKGKIGCFQRFFVLTGSMRTHKTLRGCGRDIQPTLSEGSVPENLGNDPIRLKA